jgi:hypothetical protein
VSDIYTTDIVTTVRFKVRHIGQLSDEEIQQMIPEVLCFEYMLGSDDCPTVQSYSVISDEIKHANTPEETV